MPSIRRSPRRADPIFQPHMRSARTSLILCFFVCLMVGGTVWGGQWALGWSETWPIGGVSLRSRDPVLLVGPDGGVHLLRIVEPDGEPPRLVYRVSHDHSCFSAPDTAACPWQSPRRLQAAIDAQRRIHLVWIDRVDELPAIYYAIYDQETAECSVPVRVSSYSSRIASPQLAVAGNGRILIGWVGEAGADNSIHLTTVMAIAAEEPPILLGEPMAGIRSMQFVITDNRVWLAWTFTDRLPSVEKLALQAFTFDGTPVGDPPRSWTACRSASAPVLLGKRRFRGGDRRCLCRHDRPVARTSPPDPSGNASRLF